MILEFENVSFGYEEEEILSGVSFSVEEGEFVYLTGKSGVGKSTVLRLINASVELQEGEIFFLDFVYSELRKKDIPKLRRKLGIVFQDFKFLNDRDIYANLSFIMESLGYSRRKIKKRIYDVASEIGIAHKLQNFPEELSGGELQRAAIARAVLHNPPLVLADEPTGNLDEETSEEILDLFLKINKRGTTVIFTTHDKNLILPDKKLLHIEDGKLTVE